MIHKAGKLTINVDEGGYPAWCRVTHDDFPDLKISLHHNELSDLKYVVKQAIRDAKRILPKRYRREV